MVRYAVFVLGWLCWSVDLSVSQNTNCSGDLDWLNDGFCDSATNNMACDYDGGDCCSCTCVDGPLYGCGYNGFNCLDPVCSDEDPSPYLNCTGNFNWLNDGWCEPETNNPVCGYDGGDCCECTCMDGPLYRCGSNDFDCTDAACLKPAIAAEYPECAGNWLSIGDGLCTAENNNQECGYDGGDCCLCTCSVSACDMSDFECLDPSAGDEIYDCKPAPPTSVPCPTDGQRVWIVEDSAQAMALAEAVNCSGGSFEVLWRGEVAVEKTINVFNSTVLNLTGAGLIASMDGNSAIRLLTVVDASVHVTGINMTSGAGIVGGAITATRSMLTLNGTAFVGNAATGHGGAIFASDNSVVSFVGHNRFARNSAAMDGGAVFISDSLVTSDNVSFFNNAAGDDGGAMMVTANSGVSLSGTVVYMGNRAGGAGGAISVNHKSTVLWRTATTFHSNSAVGSAGALSVQGSSSASWYGDTMFDNNSALQRAGAFSVLDGSHVSWNATTIFSNNRADWTGGAMQATNGSTVSWSGITTYVGNYGSRGGAMAMSGESTAFWGGNTTFSANIAETRGGALFVTDYSLITWDGDTAFSGNMAGDGGAVHAESNSALSFGGMTSFHGNVAHSADIPGILGSGGAVSLRDSNLMVSGETVFTGNQALGPGGAVFAVRANSVWQGRSTFMSNSCEGWGGAVSMFSSTAVFEENTLFRDNTAPTGGAVDVYDSVVTWSGDAEFVSNSAVIGGALALSSKSNVSWSGRTTLAHNNAARNEYGAGGGVSIYSGSRLSWTGETIFVNNSAYSYGGAVHVYEGATMEWSGSTTFFGCAAFFGGALFVNDGSAAEWSGQTEFSSNRATISGGAVASISIAPEQNSVLFINGNTTFSNNTAEATGGALYLSGVVYFTLQSPDVLFIGNSAKVAGGAVSVSGLGVGPHFSAVRFVANTAGVGGGAHIAGSGNEQISAAGATSDYATNFDGCQFFENRATATGGAIESVAGQDYFSNSIFVGNTAGVGGALRLAGNALLLNCSFVDNRSDEGSGPAVDNVGIISAIQNGSFIGNVFNCPPGTYLDSNASLDNVFEVACNGCAVSCQGCTFEESSPVPTCTETMQFSISPGGASTVETVSINRGFWRATSTSTDVLACYRDEACLGGVTGSPDYCLNGYEGPYCSICSDGYAASFGFACDKCSDKAGRIVLTVVLAVIVLFGAAATATFMMSTRLVGDGRGTIERVTRFFPLQSIKIVIVALQIVTQFTTIANVTYPHVFERFLNAVKVLNFDLGWISQLSVGCLFDIGIHGRLLIATIGPIIAVMFLGVTYVVAASANRGSDEALGLIRHNHVSMVLLLTFLVYSSVSSTLFQMFACDDLADNNKYLRADYRVQCDSAKHRAFQIYAGFMILLYTVGIPTLYASLLFRNRGLLNDEAGREESQRTQSFSDLWKPYKPSMFYYEVIECGRRVLLTGAVVFVYPNTSAQIAITLMIAFVFAMLSEGLAPFASGWDTWINRMGHVVVYVSMYVALLLKVDVSNEKSSSQKLFEAVLVAAHLGMVLAVVFETGVMVCSMRGTVRNGVSPMVRGTERSSSGVNGFEMQDGPFRRQD